MARIRVGVVGCGGIAQVMHLPHLAELDDPYEVVALCDVSPGALQHVGERYRIARRHTDFGDLLQEPLDAILVLSGGSHAPAVLAALAAGKHVLTEKPMYDTMREAYEILEVNKRAGTVGMVAYKKRYDPGLGHGQPSIRNLKELHAIHITILQSSEANQIGHHDIRRLRDVPAETAARLLSVTASIGPEIR